MIITEAKQKGKSWKILGTGPRMTRRVLTIEAQKLIGISLEGSVG